jgi:hypothetical protein
MGLQVIMVTGPRRAGKSTLISCLIKETCKREPHYIRLAAAGGPKRAPRAVPDPPHDCGVVTATWLTYDPRRVFETLPEALAAIHKKDRKARVIIEADGDPNLRHAYPYDCSIFAMPCPADVHEVFRTPQEAEAALHSALHDTMAFAGEVYGLEGGDEAGPDEGHEKRPDMSDSQIVRLLGSPLGADLAARIQCQPPYHGLVDSDLIVVNTGVGGSNGAVDETVRRLEAMLAKARRKQDNCPAIYCCDVCDKEDPRRAKLFEYFCKRYGSSR